MLIIFLSIIGEFALASIKPILFIVIVVVIVQLINGKLMHSSIYCYWMLFILCCFVTIFIHLHYNGSIQFIINFPEVEAIR